MTLRFIFSAIFIRLKKIINLPIERIMTNSSTKISGNEYFCDAEKSAWDTLCSPRVAYCVVAKRVRRQWRPSDICGAIACLRPDVQLTRVVNQSTIGVLAYPPSTLKRRPFDSYRLLALVTLSALDRRMFQKRAAAYASADAFMSHGSHHDTRHIILFAFEYIIGDVTDTPKGIPYPWNIQVNMNHRLNHTISLIAVHNMLAGASTYVHYDVGDFLFTHIDAFPINASVGKTKEKKNSNEKKSINRVQRVSIRFTQNHRGFTSVPPQNNHTLF